MRIDGWHIDGYGVHADLGVAELDGGLTIIAGPNESGKTTLQHFLVGMLFGFTAVNRPDHHRPLRGGTYGGRLFVTDDEGQHLTIHRGARKSSLRITHADGSPYEGDLADVVGGASKELFGSVFSVHLDDLTQLRALTEDQVRDRVFSAGILGAGRSAQAALTQLGAERDALLKPNGRGERYRIKELRSQLAEARLRLDEARRESRALPAHLRQLELLADRARSLGADAEQVRSDLALVTAVTELWPRWSAATDARHQLDQIGTVPTLPADTSPRLHTAIERHRSAAEAATRAVDELAEAEAHLAALDAPVLDLDAIDRIERLARQADAERDRAPRIEELRVRADHQRAELDRDLAILGSGRDLAWLEARPAGTGNAAGLRQATTTVTDARNDLRDATRSAEQLATDLADAAADLRHAAAALADLPPPRAAATAVLGLGAVALVAGVALLALGTPIAGGGLLAAAVACLVTGVTLRTRNTTAAPTADLDAVIDLAAEDVRRIDADLAAPLSVLRLDAVPSATEAAGIRTHAERLATAAQQAQEHRDRHTADAARHHERSTRLQAAAASRIEVARAHLQAAEAAWTEWLVGHDLPSDLDPAGATEHLAAMDRARGIARHLAHTEADLQVHQVAAGAFDDAVRALTASLDGLDGLDAPDADPVTAIDRLATRAAGQRALLLQITDAAAAVERAATAERRAGRDRAEAAEHLAADLQSIGATTVDEALATLDRVAAATELRATIDDADARLEAAVANSDDRRRRALELLATADPARWAEQAQDLRRRLTDATDDRDRCLHDQATVSAEIDKLVASADVPTCELRVSGLEAELVDAVTTWASLSLAHQMVEGTLAKYQRERQPDVVKRAAKLFTRVTGGDYVRLEVRDNEVYAIDHAEREVPAHLLSQGAREQLYLCMRVALAESFAKTTPLPLLLDDITVNADARRQQQLSDLLVTVADTQQVFAFTCHDRVVEELRQLRPEARVITLQAHRSVSGRTTRIGAVS